MLSLKRLPGWRGRLSTRIEARRHIAFAWGANDCALFAADCVEAMTGIDLAGEFRGAYQDQAGARALLDRLGAADVADHAATLLPEIAPSLARIGDIAAIRQSLGVGLVMVIGAHLVGPGPKGLMTLPLSAAVRAFRV